VRTQYFDLGQESGILKRKRGYEVLRIWKTAVSLHRRKDKDPTARAVKKTEEKIEKIW